MEADRQSGQCVFVVRQGRGGQVVGRHDDRGDHAAEQQWRHSGFDRTRWSGEKSGELFGIAGSVGSGDSDWTMNDVSSVKVADAPNRASGAGIPL